jgi:DNA (cytosine-5)-methyltransferase 1
VGVNVPRKLTIGSCFSGIGGLEKGLEDTGGFETKWQIEVDRYAQKVLEKHWPGVKRYGDIKQIDAKELSPVDVVCGGYPCQPFSTAGKRGGAEDPRHLWPDMFRIIRTIRPRFAVLENVPGHISLGLRDVLGDFASVGFDAEWSVVSACSVGAPHMRERLFVIAYPTGQRMGKRRSARSGNEPGKPVPSGARRSVPSRNFWNREWDEVLPEFCRVDDGIPNGLHRGKCLGNAVVPQVAQKIGEMILKTVKSWGME